MWSVSRSVEKERTGHDNHQDGLAPADLFARRRRGAGAAAARCDGPGARVRRCGGRPRKASWVHLYPEWRVDEPLEAAEGRGDHPRAVTHVEAARVAEGVCDRP